ncbi:MAG TPA: hypothetical protein IAA32_05465 [Candidatus Butyricicoccus stercorigallinarum]|nr:hypothetical protein [Candidatus Butyricicoccus stercorigallinarum]
MCNNSCGFGGVDCYWILILLLLFCCFGNGSIGCGGGCGGSCGCGNNCGNSCDCC